SGRCRAEPPGVALADLDARLVERAAVPVRAGTRADDDRVGVRHRADCRGLRERLTVHDELDRRCGLDALDGLPLPVVERRARDQLAVVGRALEPARRLPGLLELHLDLAAGGRV